jgi:hypothetical protein
MMDHTAAPPRALILCKDQRLSRLFEAELSYLGVNARTVESLPAPDESIPFLPSDGTVCLLLADGDEFSPADCVGLASARGCSLLIFGRNPAVLPFSSERGAYLRRPFALTELEAVLRRLLGGLPIGLAAVDPAPPASAPSLPLRADAETSDNAEPSVHIAPDGTVTAGGRTVSLTPAERAILEYLYAHRGEAVPREALSSLLGGGGNSVDVYVCKLRAKIEKPLGRRMIVTVRGVGYRMDA